MCTEGNVGKNGRKGIHSITGATNTKYSMSYVHIIQQRAPCRPERHRIVITKDGERGGADLGANGACSLKARLYVCKAMTKLRNFEPIDVASLILHYLPCLPQALLCGLYHGETEIKTIRDVLISSKETISVK